MSSKKRKSMEEAAAAAAAEAELKTLLYVVARTYTRKREKPLRRS